MGPKSIRDLLETASDSQTNHGVTFYPPGQRTPQELTYRDLQSTAKRNSRLLRDVDGVQSGSTLLLHFDSHIDHIIWLWSALYAGCTPAISLALPKSPVDCERHLIHLSDILENPVCLTRSGLVEQTPTKDLLRVVEVDKIGAGANQPACEDYIKSTPTLSPSEPALLMLTSGSTGRSKGVGLSHDQILASLSGKSATLPVKPETSFFNWIRLDHVGSLVEIHLHALYVGASQVHVQPEDIVSDPAWFLEVLHRHKVGLTFAPNFFLADLQRLLQSPPADLGPIDLSHVRYIVSGGEANDVRRGVRLSDQLVRYGAPRNAIVPGFGMTETCAGCIYNTKFPDYDVERQNDVASLGECIPGVTMRVTPACEEEEGGLQLRGSAVFSGYYNNETATAKSFTPDGWFKTGDAAVIDPNGKLNLVGRNLELISINGIKHAFREIELVIEDAEIDGVRPGSVCCFSHRRPEDATDTVGVIYQPRYPLHDAEGRYEAMNAITQRVLLQTNSRPYVLPLGPGVVDHTTLGKVSRVKLSRALREGKYAKHVDANAQLLAQGESAGYAPPQSDIEETVLRAWAQIMGMSERALGVERNMFEVGFTSVEVIKLQEILRRTLQRPERISTLTILTNPTVRSLAGALQLQSAPGRYAPVVTLQAHGEKTPLWLIHPAAGEALVFLELSRYITQRPVYGLRARGFHPGEKRFGNLKECVDTYHAAIKEQQPEGPYAIAGYSYGGMLAFELAKVLEREGDEVRFLASLNRPPYVHPNLQQVQWTTCMTHLAYFLDIIPEDQFHLLRNELRDCPHGQAVDRVMAVASLERLRELSLDAAQLEAWADVTLGLQDIARQYKPSGKVRQMDVFYCEPLAVVDCDRSEWLQRLRRWQEFVGTEIRYHQAHGHHHDMLGPKHAYSLQQTLRQALSDRAL